MRRRGRSCFLLRGNVWKRLLCAGCRDGGGFGELGRLGSGLLLVLGKVGRRAGKQLGVMILRELLVGRESFENEGGECFGRSFLQLHEAAEALESPPVD